MARAGGNLIPFIISNYKSPFIRLPTSHVDPARFQLNYLKSLGVGGAMVWPIGMDDFRGLCGPIYAVTSMIWSELNGA